MDIPNTFVAGTKAKAQEVNDNFTACKVAIDDNTSDISTLETQLSSGIILADGTVPATKNLSYTTKSIIGATNATPIVITSSGHGFITGDKVFINGVVGNTAANGEWAVTVISTSQFSLDTSVGNGAYTSGGTIYRYPNANENLVSKIYVDNNSGVSKFNTLGTVSGDFTLPVSRVTTANFTANHSISLPDVIDTNTQQTCIFDFTTSNTAYPTLNKYKALTGTIAVTDASATITGTSTLFTTELQVNDYILISGVEYQVLSITNNTTLILTVNYTGTTSSGLSTSRNLLRWTDKTQGAPPNGWVYVAGVRNLLTFKSIWENGLLYWETEYTPIGLNTIPLVNTALNQNGGIGNTNTVAITHEPLTNYPNPSYYMLDGNPSTSATPANNTPVIISYPKPTQWSNIRMLFVETAATDGVWYGSTDGVNYISIGTLAGNRSFDLTINISAGFYRYFKFVGASTANGFHFAELYPVGVQINKNYTV